MLLIHHDTVWNRPGASHSRPSPSQGETLLIKLGRRGDRTRSCAGGLRFRRATLFLRLSYAVTAGARPHHRRLGAAPPHAGAGLPATRPLSELVTARRLELRVFAFAGRCFIHLSYAVKWRSWPGSNGHLPYSTGYRYLA